VRWIVEKLIINKENKKGEFVSKEAGLCYE
jgi:hypothetical protein